MRTTYCLLGTGIGLGLVGGSLLVAFGLMYVRLYMLVRSMQPAVCSTLDADLTRDVVTCSCGWDARDSCVSRYPCVTIYVNVTADDVTLTNVTLYDSYETFALHSPKLQCSFHKCSRSAASNLQAVKSFTDSVTEPGGTFECYYSPDRRTYAIKEVVTGSTVFHCMLWPSLAVLLAVILLLSISSRGRRQHSERLLAAPSSQAIGQEPEAGCSSLERAWNKRRNYEPVSAPSV